MILRRQLIRLLMLWGLFFHTMTASAEQQLFMSRSNQPFPETMSLLQEAIGKQGYTVSRVQHVDAGLTTMGYKTDLYRVVFFAKPEELHQLAEQHPELIPYLPLQIAIFAEGNEAIIVATNPANLIDFFPNPELNAMFMRWHDDLTAIFRIVQNTE